MRLCFFRYPIAATVVLALTSLGIAQEAKPQETTMPSSEEEKMAVISCSPWSWARYLSISRPMPGFPCRS